MVTVAAVQATPVFLDREATTDKACALVKEAAGHSAELIVFPESFIPAYPDWVWRTPAWADTEFTRRFYANAVSVPGPALQRIQDAAAEVSAYVVIGVTEIDGGTLYNTLV
jgi:predicted amidohydrolase